MSSIYTYFVWLEQFQRIYFIIEWLNRIELNERGENEIALSSTDNKHFYQRAIQRTSHTPILIISKSRTAYRFDVWLAGWLFGDWLFSFSSHFVDNLLND